MKLQVIQYPHPTLRHVSRPLKRVDRELREMIAQMCDLMYEHQGVGLAGNQVDLPYRVFVANPTGDPANKESEHVFINPVILSGKGHDEGEEGCLSIPGLVGQVVRKERVKVEAYNLAGEQFVGEVDGLFARIVQHETDHLDGMLFIDRLGPAQLADLREELEEFEIDFNSKREVGELPSEEAMTKHREELERLRT